MKCRLFITKVTTLLLILAVATPASFLVLPERTEAAYPVLDAATGVNTVGDWIINTISEGLHVVSSYASNSLFVKEYNLDPVAWAVVQQLIQATTGSVVNFVSGNGTNKKPQFVQNLAKHLGGVADVVSGIDRNASGGFINELTKQLIDSHSPFAAAIDSSLRHNYAKNSVLEGFFATHQCTLDAIPGDTNSFLSGNFNEGGWAKWLSLTTDESNNPFVMYENSKSALAGVIGSAQGARAQEVAQNQGFISWCDPADDAHPAGGGSAILPQQCLNSDGTFQDAHTPGSVIKESLTKQLGASTDKLVAADEISEVIGQLAVQLVTDAIGVGGEGLAPSGGGTNNWIDEYQIGSDDEALNRAIAGINDVLDIIERYEAALHILIDKATEDQGSLNDIISILLGGYLIEDAGHNFAGPFGSCAVAMDTTVIAQHEQHTLVSVGLESAQATLPDPVESRLTEYGLKLDEAETTRAFANNLLQNEVPAVQASHDPDATRALLLHIEQLRLMHPNAADLATLQTEAQRFGGANVHPPTRPPGPTGAPGTIFDIFGGTQFDRFDLIGRAVDAAINTCCFTSNPNNPPSGSPPEYYYTTAILQSTSFEGWDKWKHCGFTDGYHYDDYGNPLGYCNYHPSDHDEDHGCY
ncbi:MAG TPA: hypothetical protein VM103_01260 [Candidatus Paceibacterota bacterium]|nr:hypothetical protein [Candidatus Paceibacterota bacterium]